jgi:phosphoenolpyruvate synthase/pyruvate phosphate dikinase
MISKEAKKYIVSLDRMDIEAFARAGSKAANLARLSQAGFPVPDGFCITIEAYRDFLRALDRPGSVTSQGVSGEELAKGILSAPLPPGLRAQVLEAYRLLRQQHGSDIKVAVRSSASVEDQPNASFAGQYTSVLNAANESDLLEAIRHCWLSASSPQVRAYQMQRELHNAQVQMAVIVQVMVQADFAGVLFTVDPLARDMFQMVVEMAPGLGDGVASGRTVPLRFTVDRQTQSPAIPVRSVVHPHAAYLERVDWKPLLDHALQIEDLFQSPQDIEWAYDNHKFWLLQSRPITVRPQGTCRQIWTRANAGEILPGVVTPLTWSIFKPTLQEAGLYRSRSPMTIHWKWRHPCGTWPDSPRLFHGRAYLELASIYVAFGCLPGVSPEIVQRLLGFEFHLCGAEEIPERRSRWHIMDPYRALRFWLEMLGVTKTLSRSARQWLNQRKADGKTCPVNMMVEQPRILLKHIGCLLNETARILGLHIHCTPMAFSAFGLLDQLIRKYADPEEVQTFEAGLIANYQNISAVQQSIAIWDIAQAARQVRQVENALFEIELADQVIEEWRHCPEAADFVNLWDSFIARFGDRSTEEFELAVAHWDEDPSLVLQTMREILDRQRPDPRERLSQQQEAEHQRIQRMMEKVKTKSSLLGIFLFRRLVAAYKEYVSLRENLKYSVIIRFNALRKMFIALGKILERKELILDYRDVFFLRYEEIYDLVQDHFQSTFDVGSLVTQRKDEYREHAEYPAPHIWLSIDGRAIPMELAICRDRDSLQGIGCSAGQITGTACVLTSVQGRVAVAPDQILVAPSIDPGLTPLFLTIAGLVTEIGGVLSHGAIVAREFGVPAVVGVTHATKIIKNGQKITVDGYTGRVYLGPIEEGDKEWKR